jgi:hypothetical protein
MSCESNGKVDITPAQRMIAGASAGVATHTAIFPLEGTSFLDVVLQWFIILSNLVA